MSTTIKVDYENNSKAWWGATWEADTCKAIPDSCRPIVTELGCDDVTVPDEDAAAFRAWAETLPGWSDGPEHARHPFTFAPVSP
jgi:hypothetical protein